MFPFVDSAFYEFDPASGKIKTTNKYCNFPYEIENQNLLNEIYKIVPAARQKVLPFLLFDPSRKTKEQAEHLRKLSEMFPVFGLKTATTYIQAFVKDLGTKGSPILDFAREKQLPIVFHSSVHPDDPWASVYDIFDFAERHPDIRVCIAHSARFVKPVLKRAAQLSNCFVDFSAFSIHCKLALQDSPAVAPEEIRFPADYSDPHAAMAQLTEVYPDTMIWGSDTPFYYWIQKYYTAQGQLLEDRLTCGHKEEARLLKSLKREIINRIAYENTLKFIFG